MANYEIENIYTYHRPNAVTENKYPKIRAKYKELAALLAEECPESRERSVALTHLETSMMWANASVARHIK